MTAALRRLLPLALLALVASASAVSAHRLDEYLQATFISVERDRVQVELVLTPGVAVFPTVRASMDPNGDGVISAAEQQAYAQRVVRDLSLSADGARVPLRLVSWKYGDIRQMKEGRADIQLELSAAVPPGGAHRTLTFENHHQSRIAAYLVNSLIPSDPDIRITAQKRNYRQSFYQVEYAQGDDHARRLLAWQPGVWAGLGTIALLLLAQIAAVWRRCARAARDATARGRLPSA